MIKTKEQYKITLAWIAKFQEAIEIHTNTERPENIHPILWECEYQGLVSQLNSLQEQVEEYERDILQWEQEQDLIDEIFMYEDSY